MKRYPNLISNSLLINETISLLRSFNGRASAVSVVDFVMKIRRPDPLMAKLLVADLIERDPRLELCEETVVLVADDGLDGDIADTEFVVFDLETTGAKEPHRVTEIGAYRVRGLEVQDTFQTLVNPETSIPPFITALTGISDEMVANAPRFAEIAGDLLEFIGDAVLVAHNSAFDMRFLNHEIGLVFPEYRLANQCLCTVQLSRRLLPDIENHKLKTVADHYSIDLSNHHRAGADAYATAYVFINLLDQLRGEGVTDLATVHGLASRRRKYARRKAA
ncbi:MAG: DNA polymerase III subunit epsilon family exonuclease [Acidobacteria bacterium OLB17]|nr:MAG: DNA polymerase III subunit epsilon family exonuclease [Acidobacteria bacterium OLB17]MCZ2390923.1 3'-5' exoribonuclease [Acidobacteriota bacterium]